MSQDEREAWLLAAAQKLQDRHVTAEVLRDAVKVISVDHPAKLISAIIGHLGSWNNIAPPELPKRQPLRIEAPDRPITIDEIRAMKPFFRKMGLKKGWITQAQFDEASA